MVERDCRMSIDRVVNVMLQLLMPFMALIQS